MSDPRITEIIDRIRARGARGQRMTAEEYQREVVEPLHRTLLEFEKLGGQDARCRELLRELMREAGCE